MVWVCAAAVAFSCLCAGFGENFTRTQDELMNKISNREIWVVNATTPGREPGTVYSLPTDLGFPEGTLENAGKITELEGVFPYFEFVSSSYEKGQTEEETRSITVTEKSGEKRTVLFGAEEKAYNFVLAPYLPDQLMDLKSEQLDESVENGIYLSAKAAEVLDVTSPEGVVLTMDALVPVALKEIELGTPEEPAAGDLDVCSAGTLSGPIRGILEAQVKDLYMQNSDNVIYLPYEQMETLLKEEQSSVRLGEGETAWRPSAFLANATGYYSVTSAKEKLERLKEDLIVYNRFQDFESMNESIRTIRDMTFIISVIVLIIIFLLMAVVYANYVEGRKYEFSILKANGLTRRDVLKLIACESFLQVVKVALAAVLIAVFLGLVANFLIFDSDMIVFDGKLFGLIGLVSLLSIVLPTIITVLFTNRYEPDAVMRT